MQDSSHRLYTYPYCKLDCFPVRQAIPWPRSFVKHVVSTHSFVPGTDHSTSIPVHHGTDHMYRNGPKHLCPSAPCQSSRSHEGPNLGAANPAGRWGPPQAFPFLPSAHPTHGHYSHSGDWSKKVDMESILPMPRRLIAGSTIWSWSSAMDRGWISIGGLVTILKRPSPVVPDLDFARVSQRAKKGSDLANPPVPFWETAHHL